MDTHKFLIQSYINSSNGDINILTKELFKQGIMSKYYDEEELILFYNKYDDSNMTEIKRECRSLVLDKAFKIKSYSCETPLTNFSSDKLNDKYQITQCYEGTLLSLFMHNDKWFVSTRRCLDSNKSVLTQNTSQKSHYELFIQTLKQSGYNSLDDFTSKLDGVKSYYFVLIHYDNKHTIDYTSEFGDNYMYLSLVSIRDEDMNELDIYDMELSFIDKNIFLPKKYQSLEDFSMINDVNYNEKPKHEGFIIKIYNKNKYTLYKLQTECYKFNQVLGNDMNIYKGFIYLYQNNKLQNYFDTMQSNLIKICNPLKTTESFYTTGIIDSVFKVCTSELFELFKMICSLKTGKNQNKELYDKLSKEYKDMIYHIRGIYYKNKGLMIDKKAGDRKYYLTINDIYNYLKQVPVNVIMEFLLARKLMFNWVNIDLTNHELMLFSKVSEHCEKINIKQCDIFTFKLHPDISPTDVPKKLFI